MNEVKKMKILLSGASGLIGRALSDLLGREGHELWALVRRPPRPGTNEISWDPREGELESRELEGFDAVVHLAGVSISSRWTGARKREIRGSRVDGTRLLAGALARLSRRPEVLLSASAVGYYGNRGDEELDESSPAGRGFLPDVCREWEEACAPAREAGIRTVNFRTGIVLSPKGGALAELLTPFRWGIGGPVGRGDQWMSWISLTDEVLALRHALRNPSVQGPVNLTAPHPVRNRDFARALGRVLVRPAFLPLPAFAVKLLFGEMGRNLLLDGQKAAPRKLLETGYAFSHPDLDSALRFELKL